MRVNGTYDYFQSAATAAAAASSSDSGFKAALAAAQSSQPDSKTGTKVAEGKEAAAPVGKKSALEQLEEYLKKTPAEHMREAILKQMGLSEADLAAMTPEQRTAVENTIAEKIREFMLGRESHLPSEQQSTLSIQSLLAVS